MVAGGGPKVGKGEQKGKLLGPKRNQEKGRSQKVWQRKPKGVPMAPFAAHVGVPLGALDRRWPRPGPGAGHPTLPESAFINFLAVLGPVVPKDQNNIKKRLGPVVPKSIQGPWLAISGQRRVWPWLANGFG